MISSLSIVYGVSAKKLTDRQIWDLQDALDGLPLPFDDIYFKHQWDDMSDSMQNSVLILEDIRNVDMSDFHMSVKEMNEILAKNPLTEARIERFKAQLATVDAEYLIDNVELIIHVNAS
jgi:hypothetical protein